MFVGDRGNNRIQILDQEGKFPSECKQIGRPSEIFRDRDDMIYVADSRSDAKRNPGVKRGIRIGSAKDGVIKSILPGFGGDPASQSVGEGVTVDANGNLHWSETSGMTIRKFVKK
ncbi:MAG: hypothetical protein Q8S00_28045 [Deltaproteobacteria bacterium]|jgi:hypothetical protein|nr:hypothetical protein [Deltaproteobacteria bacterium]MDZ4341650.1 hypothetical protein [Candidatus Binatia bacterium]